MNRTLGVRLGPKGFIKHVMNQLQANKRYKENDSYDSRYRMALHYCLNRFFEADLKMKQEEYKDIKIEEIIESDTIDCDIVNIKFKTISDITKVNSKFKNLNDNNRNKIFQYVPKQIKERYKAFETAAYEVRKDKENKVNTKIRASKNDLILLVRYKHDKTPWNTIEPTDLPEIEADFEVGRLRAEDIQNELKQKNRDGK